jgi:hypothetical protein
MPSALASHPQASNASSQRPARQSDSAPEHESLGQPSSHAHGQEHGHSVPHKHPVSRQQPVPPKHGLRLSGLRSEVSPVLAGVWTRVLATLVTLGLLWLAIYWAFVGNV